MKRVRQLLMMSFLVLGSFTAAQAASYYVDCTSGSDSYSGTQAAPWSTLRPVNDGGFAAGDTIFLKRGCTWDGGLVIRSNGTSTSPLTFTAYGTGPRPTIRNSGGGTYAKGIDIYGDYVVVEGLLVQDAHETGVAIRSGADHNIIRDIEATAVGIGFAVSGQYNLITHCYAHDLTMVINTSGGDDDYGAVGYWLYASNNEISYNKCINCRAPSYDYGYDGGFVEIYTQGNNLSNIYIHHNYAERTNGFMETGGGGSVRDVTLAYNVIYNPPGGALCLHDSGSFATYHQNIRVENNTFVKTGAGGGKMLQCMRSPGEGTLLLRNNIFYTNIGISSVSGFTHTHNLYYMLNGASIGYSLSTGEKTGNPLFVNLGAGDLHLQSGSPAIDAGINLGYSKDYEDKTVPVGAAPDMGAYEYGGASTLSPSQKLRIVN